MADRQDSDREVLTSLPRSRPVRRSAKRAARPDASDGAGSKPAPAAGKAGAAPRPRTKPAPKAAATPRAKTAAAPRAKTAATPRAKTAATPRAKAAAGDSAPPRRKIPPAGYAAPTSNAAEDPISASADLVGTAIQAAGELAQIGFAVGRQALQSMMDRLPKP